jgi:hypothetical protein
MAISSIDVMQTEQIEDLQDDVKELREKLNLLVSDITDVDGVAGTNGVVATRDGLTVKLNQAIEDASNLDSVINAGYTVASGGGSSPIGILKRMDELFGALSHHENTHTPYSYGGASQLGGTGIWEETHPPSSGTMLSQPGAASNLSGTTQAGATRSTHTATAAFTDSAAAPVYVVDTKSMITLKTVPEKRAKKLARKIQGQITAEDRVNTREK